MDDYGFWNGAACAGDIPGGSTAFEYDEEFPAGSTVSFTLDADQGAGVPFPWSEVVLSYTWGRNPPIVSGAGIDVDTDNGWFTVRLPTCPPPGTYPHGLKATHTATGAVVVLFEGTLTITRSVF